eukprot:3064981-Prymnesium_polylepis.1
MTRQSTSNQPIHRNPYISFAHHCLLGFGWVEAGRPTQTNHAYTPRRQAGADGSAHYAGGTGRLPISPPQRHLSRARGTAEPRCRQYQDGKWSVTFTPGTPMTS